jgi:hypothetical protein
MIIAYTPLKKTFFYIPDREVQQKDTVKWEICPCLGFHALSSPILHIPKDLARLRCGPHGMMQVMRRRESSTGTDRVDVWYMSRSQVDWKILTARSRVREAEELDEVVT